MNYKQWIEESAPDLIESLRGCVQIRSVYEEDGSGFPFGRGVQNCLNYMLSLAAEMGFATYNLDNHLGWCEWGEGEEMVAVLGHLDVVPEGDGWHMPPYEGRVQDGKIYGRGTMDDKGPTVAALYALKALKESGAKPTKRIRLIFGLNEENGSADMKYYAQKGQETPIFGFTPDGEYPVINGEKGLVNAAFCCQYAQRGDLVLTYIKGGTAHNIVPAEAIARLQCPPKQAEQILRRPQTAEICRSRTATGVEIKALGKGAHGGTPQEGINAIGLLMQELQALPLAPELAAKVNFMAARIGTEYDGASLGIAQKDEISGPLTLNLGTVEGDENGFEVKVNYRYPVTKSFEDCGPALEQQFAEAGFEKTWFSHKNSLYLPPESELIQKLTRVYHECTGLDATPKAIGGGTYAKMMPNTVAFGPIFPGDEVREHKPDEFIEVTRLIENAKIIAAAMYELAK